MCEVANIAAVRKVVHLQKKGIMSSKLRSLVKETKISISEHHSYAGGPGTTLTKMATARQRTPHLPPVTMRKRKVPGEDGETKLPSSNGSPVEPSNNI